MKVVNQKFLASVFKILETARNRPVRPTSRASYDDFKGTLIILDAWCAILGLRGGGGLTKELDESLRTHKMTHREVSAELSQIETVIEHELKGTRFLYLAPQEGYRYANPFEGWEEVIERFPEASRDVEEMSKCFALNRYSASVFHSLLVAESSLIGLGKFIKVNDPRSGWAAVTNRLSKIVKTEYPKRSPFERKHYAWIEQMLACVEALKNAWRNKVSHAQDKLAINIGEDFTPETAEEIIFATRALARRLVDYLPRRRVLKASPRLPETPAEPGG